MNKKILMIIKINVKVGIETAKNLISSSHPNLIIIKDDDLVEIQYLGVNFLINENHVGKFTLCEASINKLRELNSEVKVELVKG